MPHIPLEAHLPGITGLLEYRQDTAAPIRELTQILLRGESTLTRAERELIASSVSYKNNCHFCHTSHGAAAVAHLNAPIEWIDDIKADLHQIEVSPKLRALLGIAHKVQQSGKHVLPEDIENARQHGATDREIHDTVLIAAAFCMYNRYVDGLGTWAPQTNEEYAEMGQRMAHVGYNRF